MRLEAGRDAQDESQEKSLASAGSVPGPKQSDRTLTGPQFSITLLPNLDCCCKGRGKVHSEGEAALQGGLAR